MAKCPFPFTPFWTNAAPSVELQVANSDVSGASMKILYLITQADRGGAQVHVLDLIRGFRGNCDIEVAAGEDGFLLEEARQLGVTCHVVPNLVRPIHPGKDVR